MSAPFALMRRGDRGALKRLLQAHGGAILALQRALQVEAPLAELAVAIWKSSLSALRQPDPKKHALSAVAQQLVGQPRPDTPIPQVSLPAFVFAVCYEHLGLGTGREGGLVQRVLEDEPELAELRTQIVRALDAACRVTPDSSDAFDAAWPEIEPLLK